jgi:hypothetical protein
MIAMRKDGDEAYAEVHIAAGRENDVKRNAPSTTGTSAMAVYAVAPRA